MLNKLYLYIVKYNLEVIHFVFLDLKKSMRKQDGLPNLINKSISKSQCGHCDEYTHYIQEIMKQESSEFKSNNLNKTSG